MLAPFDIAGGLPLALARGLSVAGLLSVFGASLARVAVAPPALAGFERAWRRLAWISLLLAAAATAVWVWLVAGTLADTPALGDIAATLPVVLGQTLFGHVVLIRLGVLAAVAATLRLRARWPAAALAAVAVALQSAHSHAFSMDGGSGWLLASDLLHLLAAGAWLGGLLPLLLVVRIAPPAVAARACRRFSWLGGACVLVLAGTAFFQFWVLIGGLPGLIGTALRPRGAAQDRAVCGAARLRRRPITSASRRPCRARPRRAPAPGSAAASRWRRRSGCWSCWRPAC